jgi:hypothetical protein
MAHITGDDRYPIGPEPEIHCGGAAYELFTRDESLDLTYVVKGGKYDPTRVQIQDFHDVFKGWSALMHALSHTTAKHVKATHRAIGRMRRAVR